MGHHHHHHDHSHQPSLNKAFAIGVGLNLVYVGIETGYGLWANSMALLADAGHNFSDVLSLVLAWAAALMAQKSATFRHTYGFRRGTVLAALASSLLLLGAIGIIAWEAVHRMFSPAPIPGTVVMVVAAIGVIINTATALLFVKDQHNDLNVRGAFLHMAADAAVSLGVVLAGVGIYYTGWYWLDPAMSLVIVAVIFWGTWSLFRESLNLSLDAVPSHVDISAVNEYLQSVDGVTDVHDLHIWALSTQDVALTAHLVVDPEHTFEKQWLAQINQTLAEQYGIGHATLQVETPEHECLLTESC
ncbi:cation diffusion facilitator family transporter [Marinobacteraceae bacterium S3BR75-40.1]